MRHLTDPSAGKRWPGTLAGLAAIGLWSTAIACSRSVGERFGPLLGPALIFSLAGGLSWLAGRRSRAATVHPGRNCWQRGSAGTGQEPQDGGGARKSATHWMSFAFICYMLCLYTAIGLAADRNQVLEVTLLNYLWPTLTLLLAGPLLGHRLRPGFLLAGGGTALAGIGFAIGWNPTGGGGAPIPRSWLANLLALGAAGSWAWYSNLVRRTVDLAGPPTPDASPTHSAATAPLQCATPTFRAASPGAARHPGAPWHATPAAVPGGDEALPTSCRSAPAPLEPVGPHGVPPGQHTASRAGESTPASEPGRADGASEAAGPAVPGLLLLTAALFWAGTILSGAPWPALSDICSVALAELAFVAILPTWLAYSLWEHAMRHGHLGVVAAAANAIPLLSIGVAWLHLGVAPPPSIWLATVLIIGGAWLSKRGVIEPARG